MGSIPAGNSDYLNPKHFFVVPNILKNTLLMKLKYLLTGEKVGRTWPLVNGGARVIRGIRFRLPGICHSYRRN